MVTNRLRALGLSAWLLWGLGLLMLIEDIAGWWLSGDHFPRLLSAVAALACGNAVEHARALLDQQQSQLEGLRDLSPGPRS
jgi:hypothetical protein